MTTASHEDYSRAHAVKGSSDKSFGLVFAAFFALIGLWPVIHGEAPRWWLVGIGAAFLIVAFVRPSLLAVPNLWWMKFGLLLAKIVNPLVMGLVFYLTVTPTAAIMRMMGKDPLRLGYDRAAKSYWIERTPPGPAPDTMSRQF
jgi:hypothetical protein